MNHFQYNGDELYAEEVRLADIVATVGSPVYVYSLATLERHFKAFDDAFAQVPHTICYSVKANSTQSVLKTFGVDDDHSLAVSQALWKDSGDVKKQVSQAAITKAVYIFVKSSKATSLSA